MKCDNCGNEFKSSLKCPLCGHRQGKISHCPVCQSVIHYGQPRCSNCGNPTKYEKKVDISKKYTSSFTTANKTNYNKRSDYQQQEMYDYKSSNNEIKQRLEEARQRINNLNFPINKQRKANNNQVKNIIGGVVVLFIAVVIILGQILPSFQDGDDYQESPSLGVAYDNENITQQGNMKNGGYAFLKDSEIYFGIDGLIYRTDSNFDNYTEITDEGNQHIYCIDDYIYCEQWGTYIRYDTRSEQVEELFEMNNVLPINFERFLYTSFDETGLFVYDALNNKTTKLVNEDILSYSFDDLAKIVYYTEIGGETIQTVDLNGNKGSQIDISGAGNIYVSDGIIYYQDYQGVHRYDIETKTDELLITDEVNNYIVTLDYIIYTNYDDELYCYDGDTTLLDDEVATFNVIGNLVIYSDEYLENWYVCNYYGDGKAKLNNNDE